MNHMPQYNMSTTSFEYVIIGGGPAGIQLGYFLQKNNSSYIILEKSNSVGSFFEVYPRHRTLISINKLYTGFEDPEINLRWDWNSLVSDSNSLLFSKFSDEYFPSADCMPKYLRQFQNQNHIKVKHNIQVTEINRIDETFVLKTSSNITYFASKVIIATGLFQPNLTNFIGSEFVENYAKVSISKEEFRDKRVFILGKGNSAFETAENLINITRNIHVCSPNPVRLAWKTHFVGDVRALNNNFLDTYQLKSQNTILDATVLEIKKTSKGAYVVKFKYSHAKDQEWKVEVDRVIGCTGWKFDDTIFHKDCTPKTILRGKFPEQTCEWESVNIPGLFFGGTLMQARDYRKTFSGFIHGFRYNLKAMSQIFQIKYENSQWPYTEMKSSLATISDYILTRIHSSSSLFQQPGFFCDCVFFSPNSARMKLLSDIPVDYLNDKIVNDVNTYIIITLEYGKQNHSDPFSISRSPLDGDNSHFIHPYVRIFEGKTLSRIHQVPEDLENNWNKTMYVEPLKAFLCEALKLKDSAPEALNLF